MWQGGPGLVLGDLEGDRSGIAGFRAGGAAVPVNGTPLAKLPVNNDSRWQRFPLATVPAGNVSRLLRAMTLASRPWRCVRKEYLVNSAVNEVQHGRDGKEEDSCADGASNRGGNPIRDDVIERLPIDEAAALH